MEEELRDALREARELLLQVPDGPTEYFRFKKRQEFIPRRERFAARRNAFLARTTLLLGRGDTNAAD